ncbi:glucose-6-phosphate dehydrogenase [Modestobacter marinus]|uniref:Glucose-6-phosphate 1-dehydrogenase n=1 Tax=Modestobacter marinus TaxID=477641 RepID=A0A846LN44_9ACTN|nr:glucose-6-phosphate dehydrogenase [Modestobacter marinus]NIH68861.1 glucose-6-phosphate 1-dehydrogenase [Modestobacter marinus]GGL60615.1 glucose-6-phosphate 1-dehydrogenase [Modestobacter marinus]
MIARLLLLGATGDLAGRFLLPALAASLAAGRLPEGFALVGAAEQDWDDARFAGHVAARLQEHAGDVPAAARQALVDAARYRRVDLTTPGTVADAVAASGGSGPLAVYLALPPVLFPAAVRALGAAGLPPGSRIAVEKPFGRDLADARALNALLAQATGDVGDAYRVDHFLGMPAVATLAGLRRPGGVLAGRWSAEHLARVDVVWEETLDAGGRAGFYDRTGAVRDVLQNHLVQVLTVLAMELPATPAEADLHRARLDLLRSVRVPEVTATRRARYTAGGPVPAYVDADGVDPARCTETFAELEFAVDTPRWAGTRFVLRTGKALAADRKRVVLHLRAPAPDAWPPEVRRLAGDRLEVPLDGARHAGAGVAVQAPGERTAYVAVLTDLLSGSSRTAVSAAEAEEAWRFVDPVLRAWAAGEVPLEEYPAGSGGPGPG